MNFLLVNLQGCLGPLSVADYEWVTNFFIDII